MATKLCVCGPRSAATKSFSKFTYFLCLILRERISSWHLICSRLFNSSGSPKCESHTRRAIDFYCFSSNEAYNTKEIKIIKYTTQNLLLKLLARCMVFFHIHFVFFFRFWLQVILYVVSIVESVVLIDVNRSVVIFQQYPVHEFD